MELDDTLLQTFKRDGHVVVPSLLDVAACKRYAGAVEGAVAHRKRLDTRKLADKSTYEQSFIQCQNLWEDFEAVRALTFEKCIAETAAKLLGVPGLRLWHDQALIKEAGGRVTDPHQDFSYWPIDDATTITAWVPLAGASKDDGCLEFLSGSHLVGYDAFANIFSGEGIDEYLAAPELEGLSWSHAEVPPGGVSFHHGLTVHRAGPNETHRDRLVHTMIFFADGARRKGTHDHPCVARPGVKEGGLIDSALTPLVWPRGETLPEPPDFPWPESAKIGQRVGAYPPNK